MTNDEKTYTPLFTLEDLRDARSRGHSSGFMLGVICTVAVVNIARALGWLS